MKPSNIRVAALEDGNIEASALINGRWEYVYVYKIGGGCFESSVPTKSDEYRWLVTAAREQCAV